MNTYYVPAKRSAPYQPTYYTVAAYSQADAIYKATIEKAAVEPVGKSEAVTAERQAPRPSTSVLIDIRV